MNGNGCIWFVEVLHQNIFHSYHTFLRNVKPRLAHCHGVSLMMTKVMSKTLTTSLIHGHSDPELFFQPHPHDTGSYLIPLFTEADY